MTENSKSNTKLIHESHLVKIKYLNFIFSIAKVIWDDLFGSRLVKIKYLNFIFLVEDFHVNFLEKIKFLSQFG